jgi:FkbM family methyltransferase
MKNETAQKKYLLDHFDIEYFGPNHSEDKEILNRVGKVNVGWNLEYLKTLPAVGAIVDVGAADDFHTLHDSQPEAYSILIDANDKYITTYEKYLLNKQGEYRISAVSDVEKVVQYKHYIDQPYLSTVGERDDQPEGRVEVKELHSRRLDQLVPFDRLQHGVLLKIDIEGSEVPALMGANALLSLTKVVICECSLDANFPGGDNFTEIFILLTQKGFKVKDIIRVPRLHHNKFPAQIIDVVFVRD